MNRGFYGIGMVAAALAGSIASEYANRSEHSMAQLGAFLCGMVMFVLCHKFVTRGNQ